jgi:membrane protease YdiL (CAAX protease family)
MPSGPQVALAVVGPVVHAAFWAMVRWRRVPLVAASGITMAVLGVSASAIGPVAASRRFDPIVAVGIGLATGVALYGATVAFMSVARRVPAVTVQTEALYGEGASRSMAAVLAVSILVSVPGEELLWRGVVLGVLGRSLGSGGLAAVLCWAAFVAINAISGRIPVILGAGVGGAVWTAVAWWTGGIVAPIVSHAAWTALMIVLPPPGARS